MSHHELPQNPKKSWFLAIPLLLLAMGAGCVSSKEEASVNTSTNTASNTSASTNTSDPANTEVPVASTNTETPVTSINTQTTTEPVKTEETPETTFVYKNGTYTATGSYKSPAGEESVPVSLTIKDDTVVDATFAVTSSNAVSQKFQTMFSEGYKAVVIGKKLSDLNLSKVSGSSLTPKGFNDAVAQIKTQAAM